MRIAYLTVDDVNHDLARRIADECGATLEVLALNGPISEGAYDAALVDWDYLPADLRLPILAILRAGQQPCPTAVHAYHLADDVRDTLSQNGVVIHRRLERRWLMCWLRRVGRGASGQRPRQTAASPA